MPLPKLLGSLAFLVTNLLAVTGAVWMMWWAGNWGRYWQTALFRGVSLGMVGILAMGMSYVSGYAGVPDLRAIPILLAGVFYGSWAAGVASALVVLAQLLIGGPAMAAGLAEAFTALAVAVALRVYMHLCLRRQAQEGPNAHPSRHDPGFRWAGGAVPRPLGAREQLERRHAAAAPVLEPIGPYRLSLSYGELTVAGLICGALQWASLIPSSGDEILHLRYTWPVFLLVYPAGLVATAHLLQAAMAERWARRYFEATSLTDPLTGVYNRRALQIHLAEMIEQSSASGLPLSVAVIDVDNFKEVNDRLGHPAGDQVLCRLVEAMLRELRQSDRLYRWGGDEFVLVLGATDRAQADSVAERLQLVTSRVEPPGQGIRLAVSIGVASFPQDGENIDALLDAADADMYRHKHVAATL